MDSEKLLKRLSGCKNLPSMPAVALRVVRLGQDPEVRIGKVVDVISMDPALAAKILRIANSAFYARRRKAENLRQAIVLLGLHGTLSLALSFSLVTALQGSRAKGLDYNLFWRRSLTAGICAKAFGTHLRLTRGEELFLAGLLQDIGMLALDKAVPGLYQELSPRQEDHQFVQALERKSLGADHAAAGAWLLETWNLPKIFCSAVGGSHNPEDVEVAPEHRLFLECVAASGPLADIWLREDQEQASQEGAAVAANRLGIEPETLVSLLDSVTIELRETATILDLDLGDPVLAESLLEHAKEILLLRTLQTMRVADKFQKTSESLQSRTRELEERSRRDGLTGLYNRAYLDEMLSEEFEEAKKYGWPLTVILIDLDHFKDVNDTYGHQAGDSVLVGIARLLESNFRETDTVARYGGEEFAAVLVGTTSGGARAVCDRLVKAFQAERHQVRGKTEIVITASIGIATQGEAMNFDTVGRLLEAADLALYAAKEAGRNQSVVYKPTCLT